jgi:hypothetical protein
MTLFTVNAPTLYQLLWQAAESFGASPALPDFFRLPCPLTVQFMRRSDRADSLRGIAVLASVVGLVVLIGVSALIGVLWLLRR